MFAKMAARGMANPDDDPRLKGTPSQEQIDTDTRSNWQPQHDALTAIGRMGLASGKLGKHDGLPVTVVVTTTLQELESAAGAVAQSFARYLHPSCRRVMPSFQIFVMWRILAPSNSMT